MAKWRGIILGAVILSVAFYCLRFGVALLNGFFSDGIKIDEVAWRAQPYPAKAKCQVDYKVTNTKAKSLSARLIIVVEHETPNELGGRVYEPVGTESLQIELAPHETKTVQTIVNLKSVFVSPDNVLIRVADVGPKAHGAADQANAA